VYTDSCWRDENGEIAKELLLGSVEGGSFVHVGSGDVFSSFTSWTNDCGRRRNILICT
jgi:hypothetical protein